MTSVVVPLPADEWRSAGRMLARAFAEDPVRLAMFPDPQRRPAQLEVHFTAGLHQLMLGRQVVETVESRAAVAVWSPPGQSDWPLALAALRTVPRDLVDYARVGVMPRAYGRMLSLLLHYGRRHRELMTQPHWYLTMLGVEPAMQRYGLGAVLVLSGLARADADGVPAYVETETERNAAFYGKCGFETAYREGPAQHPLGCSLWCMVRQPGAPLPHIAAR